MSFWLSMLSGSVCISDKIKYTTIRPLYVLFEGVADIHIIYIYTSVMIWNRGKHEFVGKMRHYGTNGKNDGKMEGIRIWMRELLKPWQKWEIM